MQFTPQQLIGGAGYGTPKTKIGNYSEDLALQEERMKQYQKLKAQGLLTTQVLKKKLLHHEQPVSKSSDDLTNVTFGERYLLFSEEGKGFLSGDLERIHHVKNRYPVTVAKSQSAMNRNTFVIEPVEEKRTIAFNPYSEDEKNVLHFGQSFRIRCLDSFYQGEDGPLYLRTERQSHVCCSKLTTSAQEVSLDDQKDYSTLWKLVLADPSTRIEYEDEIVPARTKVCIVHVQTGQFLAASGKYLLNDFGKEEEVCGKRFLNHHKVEEENNVWYLV